MAMKYRKEIRLDGYTDELLEELKGTGKFGSEAAIIRLSIQELHRKFKAAGGTQWEANKIPQSLEVAFKSPC